MSVAWTVKQMKSWYDKLSKDFNSITRRELAEELREGMTSAKVYPYSARGYISKWYVKFSEYYSNGAPLQRSRAGTVRMLGRRR